MDKKICALWALCLISGGVTYAQEPSLSAQQWMCEVDSLVQVYESRPLLSIYDKTLGKLEISNLSLLTGYSMVVELQFGSEIVAGREFVLDDLSPFGTVCRQLEIESLPESEDSFLNLYYFQEGLPISSEQLMVDRKPHHRAASGGTVKIDEVGGNYLFQGIGACGKSWQIGIDSKSGFLASYKIDGCEYISSPVRPHGWADSDVSFVVLKNNGTVVVNSSKGMVIYAVSGDGTIFVSLRECMGTAFCGCVSSVAVATEYFGRGPHNCFGPRARYGHISCYQHEPGWVHSNMKWFKLNDTKGVGLVFESDYDFVATTDTCPDGVAFSLSFVHGISDFYIYPSE